MILALVASVALAATVHGVASTTWYGFWASWDTILIFAADGSKPHLVVSQNRALFLSLTRFPNSGPPSTQRYLLVGALLLLDAGVGQDLLATRVGARAEVGWMGNDWRIGAEKLGARNVLLDGVFQEVTVDYTLC